MDLRGEQASEVSFCDFYGGQGCLCFKGNFSDIHHNNFFNRQTVTNHYSVMAMGDGSRVFANLFKPEIGSGLEIFRHRNIEIFNNEFHISAAPPSCEYNRHLSTNAIRMADYGAAKGSPVGCYGIRVYDNKFFITGRKYEKFPDYIPMASAFFYSSSAGDNEIFGNDISINQEEPETDAEAFAFYIGNADGGKIFNNKVVSNVTPVWVASSYGKAENTDIADNIFEKSASSDTPYIPVRMGSHEQPDYLATGTRFRSNEFIGLDFGVWATDQHHTYSVAWTLTVKLLDRSGKPLAGREISVTDRNGKEVLRMATDAHGKISAELTEYNVDGDAKTFLSPYTITAGRKKLQAELVKNMVVDLELK